MIYSLTKSITLFLAITLIVTQRSSALNGVPNAHDSSTIIKEGNTYWVFATSYPWRKEAVGNGIYTMYSTDLINWKPGKRIFDGAWPKWINTHVPRFAGNFWAPEVIYMNGKYYMYYSCSVYQTPTACIGVASSPTLDPDSPNYKWTDLGMVAKSAVNTDINAIDAGAFVDANGRAYLVYGSYSAGIGIIELNNKTGLPLQGATVKIIAGGGRKDWEAANIVKLGSYYYIFVNRGGCCNGTASTYRLVMGRATNPMGPYLDQTGRDLVGGNGTPVLGASGKFIGPGHFGLFRENGVNYVSMHYYYGPAFGDAYLDIATLNMAGSWPVITRNWLPDGPYSIQNKSNGQAWEVTGCRTTGTQPVSQNLLKNSNCQKWNLKALGDGYYSFTNAQTGSQVAEVVQCGTGNGSKIQTAPFTNTSCQKFRVERAADGTYVLTPSNYTRVVEVPGNVNTPSAQLALYDYNGCSCQKWTIAPFGSITTALEEADISSGFCYPNPFTESMKIKAENTFEYKICDMLGNMLEQGKGENEVVAGNSLDVGLYVVSIQSEKGIRSGKIVKR